MRISKSKLYIAPGRFFLITVGGMQFEAQLQGTVNPYRAGLRLY